MNFCKLKWIAFSILICIHSVVFPQNLKRPKLVVSIVVDQMRAEYLNRFYNYYGNNGFKRLLKNGFNCRNTHINYVPTYTGPGHSSIFTGTVPKYHGIIGNSWYDRKTKQVQYCTFDSTVQSVGCSGKMGQQSPRLQLALTVADELEISTQRHSLTYSISLKDRAAILSAGHLADGVFWYDNTTGNFISSTYYMKKLPDWLENFNSKKLTDKYMQQDWDLSLPSQQYNDCYNDENPYEHPNSLIPNIQKAVFPYHLADISKHYSPYDLLIHTPYGNTLLTDLAIETINNVNFGADDNPDMLMISFSSTDAIGHLWGPQSKEVKDTYIRLDKEIARILEALDKKVGKDNYLLVLTADHGVGEVSQALMDLNVPAGYLDFSQVTNHVDSFLNHKYGKAQWVEYVRNNMIYFNYNTFSEKNIDPEFAAQLLQKELLQIKGIESVFTAKQLQYSDFHDLASSWVYNGFNCKRSGDLVITLEPCWTGVTEASADHGTFYNYDTNVPLLWYGINIKKGESVNKQYIVDIAPTLSFLLKIKLPGATIGNPVEGIGSKYYNKF